MAMNIGEAAAQSQISAKMIRYYEDIGLLPAPARRPSGYRLYEADDVHRLRFIRRARDFGFSMPQIRELLALWSDRSRSNAEVKQIALAHAAALEAKIADLSALRKTLATLARTCHGDGRPDCPILDNLAEEG
ncbi:Cu(I)-responsive transcriptional regulator [soil metagenome]